MYSNFSAYAFQIFTKNDFVEKFFLDSHAFLLFTQPRRHLYVSITKHCWKRPTFSILVLLKKISKLIFIRELNFLDAFHSYKNLDSIVNWEFFLLLLSNCSKYYIILFFPYLPSEFFITHLVSVPIFFYWQVSKLYFFFYWTMMFLLESASLPPPLTLMAVH